MKNLLIAGLVVLTLAASAFALVEKNRRPRIKQLIAAIDAQTLTAAERDEALKLCLLDLLGE